MERVATELKVRQHYVQITEMNGRVHDYSKHWEQFMITSQAYVMDTPSCFHLLYFVLYNHKLINSQVHIGISKYRYTCKNTWILTIRNREVQHRSR